MKDQIVKSIEEYYSILDLEDKEETKLIRKEITSLKRQLRLLIKQERSYES